MVKLLITDLDDTLYSWLGFFIPAFYAMAEEASAILHTDRETLLAEYRAVHKRKGSVEYPYSTLSLPSVKAAFPDRTRAERREAMGEAFHRFNSVRKQKLALYPGVRETLTALKKEGCTIVGYTESAEENGFYRLSRLGIADLFTTVYVSDSPYKRPAHLPSSDKTRIVSGKKPNPELLRHILAEEGVSAEEAIYMGDRMTKDVYMARKAGITAVLCRLPQPPDAEELYRKLTVISHWTREDYRREEQLRQECERENIRPDYILEDFSQLRGIILEQKGCTPK